MLEPNDYALREAHHRCSNDLQLVVSMLQLTANRSEDPHTRQTLLEVANRVRVLARSRAELIRSGHQALATVLRDVCDSLQVLAEPHGVLVRFSFTGHSPPLADAATVAAGLVVNELVTNSIKHAFKDRASGEVMVQLDGPADGWLVIQVDDDGLPFSASTNGSGTHQPLGLDLARRMLAAQGGMLIAPAGDSKRFEIRLPSQEELH